MIDIIIPLGNESKSQNDELRILLRSIEKYGQNYRNIIVVTDCPPDWITNVKIVKCSDTLQHNKDGNIINKVLCALREIPDITDEFIFSADDAALIKPVDFTLLPPITNSRARKDFNPKGNNWQKRMCRTFDFFTRRGTRLTHNYESHTPQRFPTQKLLKAIDGVDYESNVGYGICTLFYGLLGITGGFDQRIFKETCESNMVQPRFRHHFIGYNDSGFIFGGVREALLERFPNKSKYER